MQKETLNYLKDNEQNRLGMKDVKKSLLIISCSKRKKLIENEPAIEVYDGPYYRILRKAAIEYLEIKIVSAKYGLIDSKEIISYYDEPMTKQRAIELRNENDKKLLEDLKTNNYSHVLILLGENYRNALDLNLPITYIANYSFPEGPIGMKLHELKIWLGNIYAYATKDEESTLK